MNCMVAHCPYLAESSLDDFAVCALHDAPHVRAILEDGRLPGAYFWPDGRPLVIPCGELQLEHFEPSEGATMRAADDPMMAEVPEKATMMVWKQFDLTQEWEVEG